MRKLYVVQPGWSIKNEKAMPREELDGREMGPCKLRLFVNSRY